MSTFIEQEQQYSDVYDDEPHFQKKVNCRTIFCSKIVKGVLVALAIAIIFPFLAYHLAISRTVTDDDNEQRYSCLVQQEYRISCGFDGISSKECEAVFCCFNKTTGQCHHYLPSKYYYETKKSGDSYVLTAIKAKSPVKSNMVSKLKFTAKEEGKKLSLILQESDSVGGRSSPISDGAGSNFKIIYSNNKMILDVRDKENDIIFNTANAALIASKYYWEWSFQFPNHTLFGLNQNVIRLTGNETLKQVIYKSQNDHNTQPVIWTHNKNKFYGFLVKNTGPVELTILPSNIIIVRSLVGNRFEVEITQGPSPKDVYNNQIDNFVLSPKWALGTHNCRKGDETELADILKTYADVSFNTECIHENLYLSLQKGTSSDDDIKYLTTTLGKILSSETKFVLSLQPHIVAFDNNTLYNEYKNSGIFYKNSSGNDYRGSYLGLPVVYPDYTHPNIRTFTEQIIQWIFTKLGANKISGLVLSENWLQDDSVDEVDNSSFPYYTKAINKQMQYTIPWNLKTNDGKLHMEIHNSYGSLQYNVLKNIDVSSISTTEDMSDFFIASASKLFGDNEPEISDNFSTSWDYFKIYLDKILFSSITGDYMVGLPICGDTKTYNKTLHETLCLRWYTAAATMPYFRVSSGDPYRDPYSLYNRYTTHIVENIIKRRKMFQDYYYTIISDSKLPLVRPMYFDYYKDTTTFTLEGQYAVGEDIIVAHPLTSGRWRLQVYLPPKKTVWYELWAGTMFIPAKKNKYMVDIDIIESDWISFIAQGTIIALTDDKNTFNFYIALDCSSSCTANGTLYKDGTHLSFTSNGTALTIDNLSGCNYLMGYVNYYGYSGSSGYRGHVNATKISLCEADSKSKTIIFKPTHTSGI